MRKLSILCAALFCFSLTASAQDSTAAFDASSPASEPAAPASLIPADREPWQFGVGFQYSAITMSWAKNFIISAIRRTSPDILINWFGVEGTAIAGFGSVGIESQH